MSQTSRSASARAEVEIEERRWRADTAKYKMQVIRIRNAAAVYEGDLRQRVQNVKGAYPFGDPGSCGARV